jgi:hypothetical protein
MVKTRSLWCAVPVAVIAVLVALFVRDATNTSIEGLQLQGKRVVVCGASMGIGTLHCGSSGVCTDSEKLIIVVTSLSGIPTIREIGSTGAPTSTPSLTM